MNLESRESRKLDRHVVECLSGLSSPRFGIWVALSALQDFNCFVGTLELEFSYRLHFVDLRRQVLCYTVQVKPPYVKTQLWFIDSVLATTTRGLCEIPLDHVLAWLRDVTTLQGWWWWWWWCLIFLLFKLTCKYDQIHITPNERKITIKLHIDHTYHNKSYNYIITHRFGQLKNIPN